MKMNDETPLERLKDFEHHARLNAKEALEIEIQIYKDILREDGLPCSDPPADEIHTIEWYYEKILDFFLQNKPELQALRIERAAKKEKFNVVGKSKIFPSDNATTNCSLADADCTESAPRLTLVHNEI